MSPVFFSTDPDPSSSRHFWSVRSVGTVNFTPLTQFQGARVALVISESSEKETEFLPIIIARDRLILKLQLKGNCKATNTVMIPYELVFSVYAGYLASSISVGFTIVVSA